VAKKSAPKKSGKKTAPKKAAKKTSRKTTSLKDLSPKAAKSRTVVGGRAALGGGRRIGMLGITST
jgi:hypothetical protein